MLYKLSHPATEGEFNFRMADSADGAQELYLELRGDDKKIMRSRWVMFNSTIAMVLMCLMWDDISETDIKLKAFDSLDHRDYAGYGVKTSKTKSVMILRAFTNPSEFIGETKKNDDFMAWYLAMILWRII